MPSSFQFVHVVSVPVIIPGRAVPADTPAPGDTGKLGRLCDSPVTTEAAWQIPGTCRRSIFPEGATGSYGRAVMVLQ